MAAGEDPPSNLEGLYFCPAKGVIMADVVEVAYEASYEPQRQARSSVEPGLTDEVARQITMVTGLHENQAKTVRHSRSKP